MAEIKQELVLEDKFSRVLDDFLKRLEKIEEIQEKLQKQSKQHNDDTDELKTKFDKLNSSAINLADNGLNKLQSRLLKLGTAFIGFRALYSSFMGSVADSDMNIKFNNRSGVSGDVNGAGRALSLKYGGEARDYANTIQSMSRYSNTNQLNRMQDIGAKLASITPGMNAAAGMAAVNSAMYSRSGTGLINQFGLNANRSERHQVDILLQQGRLDEALDIIERLSEAAGATEKSLNNMLNSPSVKLARMKALLDDIKRKIGDELLNALSPVIDAVDRLIKSEGFQTFVNRVLAAMRMLGNLVGEVINYMVENWDRISAAIKKVLPYLGIALGLLTLYKILMITIPPIISAFRIALNLATAAQWALNAAMNANPIGLVVAAVVLLIGALVAITGKFDKVNGPFLRFVGVLAAVGVTIKNIFGGIWNVVANPLQYIIKNVAILINTLGMLKNPVIAVQYLFKAIFINVQEMVSGLLKTIGGLFEKLGALENLPILGGAMKGVAEAGSKLKGLGEGFDINKQRDELKAWLEANGMKELIGTDFQLPTIEMGDPKKAYTDSIEWVKNLIDKNKELADKIGENTKAQNDANNALDNLGSIIDKKSWMDRFNFSVQDAERKAVSQANNNYNSSVNITVNGGVKSLDDEKVLNEFKKAVAEENQKMIDQRKRLDEIASKNAATYTQAQLAN